MPKFSFRYGLDRTARAGLLMWSFVWLIGVIFVLFDGQVHSHQITYTRADDPAWYWTLVCAALAMIVLGLALTFEVSFRQDDSESRQTP